MMKQVLNELANKIQRENNYMLKKRIQLTTLFLLLFIRLECEFLKRELLFVDDKVVEEEEDVSLV